MVMPASACPALQRRAAQSVDSVSHNSGESEKAIPVSRRWSGSPLKFNHFVHWPIANLPVNFMQIRSGVFAKVADKQTKGQTDRQRRKHNLHGEVITCILKCYGVNQCCISKDKDKQIPCKM